MAIPLDRFVQHLTDSGLISADEVAAFQATLPKAPTDGESLAKLLVRHNKLTLFQAQQICGGKGKSLVLGNYVLLDKLGQGGMGMVLKAEHRRMKRLVALKVLSPNVSKTTDTLRRFQREVEAAAKLRHPNIVAADDADEANGVHFLVMEYVEGSDLSALVKKHGPLPPDDAVQYVAQAARGLEYAHNRGIVHRDIKPANLLLAVSDQQSAFSKDSAIRYPQSAIVKILDMGLARLEAADSQQDELTGTGQIMGTVAYMAPEQALNTKNADARADIYSLGVTLWYLLTARPMYEAETAMETLMAHQSQPVPSLAEYCSEATTALQSVFERMVAKTPAMRYQTMGEVIVELERCRSDSASVPSMSMAAGAQAATRLPGGSDATGGTAEFTKPPVLTKRPPVKAAPAKETDATVSFALPQVETDPETRQSLPVPLSVAVRQVASRGRRSKQPPLWLIALGAAAAFVFVVAGIWIILRDRDGKEVARFEVPDGGKAEIVDDSRAGNTEEASGRTGEPAIVRRREPQATDVGAPETEVLWQQSPHSAYTDLVNFQGRWLCVFRSGQAANSFDGQLRLLASVDGKTWRPAAPITSPGRDLRDPRLRITPDGQLMLIAATRTANGDEQSFVWYSKDGEQWTTGRNVGDPGWRMWDMIWQGRNGFGMPYRVAPPFGVRLFGGSEPQNFRPVSQNDIRSGATEAALLFLPDARLLGVVRRTAGSTALMGVSSAPFDTWTWKDVGQEVAGARLVRLSDGRLVLASRLLKPTRMSLCWLDVDQGALTEFLTLATSDDCGYPGVVEFDGQLWVSYYSSHEGQARVYLAKILIGPTSLPPAANPSLTAPAATFALEFDGKDDYVLLSAIPYKANDPLTFEAWVTPTIGNADVVKGSNPCVWGNGGWFLILTGWGWQHFHADMGPGGGQVVAGRRYYLAAQWDGSTCRLFINGIAVPVDSRRAVGNDALPRVLGCMGDSASQTRFFPGRMDEVRISNIARYDKNFTPPENGIFAADKHTMALYHFDEGTGEMLRDSSGHNRDGKIVGAKWVRIDGSAGGSGTEPLPAKAPFDAGAAKDHQQAWAKYLGTLVETSNSVGMKCVLIPPGEFLMGRRPGESTRFPPNGLYKEPTTTQHKVTLTHPFQMGATEVTQRQWREVMGSEPWLGKDEGKVGDDYPATYTTKPGAQDFCRRLSEKEGKRYRLPTEAEWEFACRAGADTLYFFGENHAQVGEYACRGSLQPVATKKPNPWGLFDMYGNVWEWVADGRTDFTADAAVDPLLNPGNEISIIRGSCFRSAIPAEFSSGARHSWPGTLPADEEGFRVVCEVAAGR